MADYYVKTGGNNELDGLSDGNAWATVAKVASFSASPGFAPADTISFNRGDTFTLAASCRFRSSGSEGSPIVIGAYGTGALPIIDGDSIAQIYGFDLEYYGNVSWLTIENIKIVNAKYGIGINSCHDIIIDGCIVDSCTAAGQSIIAGESYNITVQNTTISNGVYGIYWIGSASNSIRNTVINTCIVDTMSEDGIIIHEDSGTNPCGAHHLIKNTVVRNCTGQGMDIVDGSDITIDNCETHNNGAQGLNIGPGANPLSRVVVKNCNIHHEVQGILIQETLTATVVGTRCTDCTSYALIVGRVGATADPNTNITVTDSIFSITADLRPIYVATGTDGFVFKRNIVIGTADIPYYIGFYTGLTPANTNCDFDNNVYHAVTSVDNFASDDTHGVYTDLADWQTDASQDANSAEADPLLANISLDMYYLTRKSPALVKGFNVPLLTIPRLFTVAANRWGPGA
ncbi:MAG: right-handed parallel beta-helix repeat-containing protein [Planctomycetota bacterium]